MAKSIRSKFKRKMRAITRKRNSVKDLKVLKHILGIEKIPDTSLKRFVQFSKKDVDTEKEGKMDAEEIIVEESEDIQPAPEITEAVKMDSGDAIEYDSKTKRDEHGQYPGWMNQKAIKKTKNKSRKQKGKGDKTGGTHW